MCSIQYCNISCAWEPEGYIPIASVTDYNILEETTLIDKSQRDSASDDEEETQLTKPLSFTQNEKPCVLELCCSQQYAVAITGFCVYSNARHIEVSAEVHGYLNTVSGKLCNQCGEEKIYKTRFKTKSHYNKLKLQFVSLSDKTQLKLFDLSIDLVRLDDPPPGGAASVDITRVNELMKLMEIEASDSAQGLIEALQVAQQRPSHLGDQKPEQDLVSGLSSFLSSMQGQSSTSAATDILQSMAAGLLAGGGDTKQMYGMLHNICSQVTRQREEVQHKTDEIQTPCEPNAVANKDDNAIEDLKASTARNLEAMEERIMTRVEERLNQVEQKIDQKLDMLLAAVTGQNHKQQPDLNQD